MAGQPEHRYFLGQPQHRYPLIAPSDDPFTLNGGTTGTGNGPAQGLHLLNEPQHGFQSGSEASTNTLLAAYSIDPHTQQPYEPIEDYQVELLYRGDPGWYFQSLAGCVYHLVRKSKGRILYETFCAYTLGFLGQPKQHPRSECIFNQAIQSELQEPRRASLSVQANLQALAGQLVYSIRSPRGGLPREQRRQVRASRQVHERRHQG